MTLRSMECSHIKFRHSDHVRKPPAVTASVILHPDPELARTWRRDVRNHCKLAGDTHVSVSGERQTVDTGGASELYTPAQATTIRESWDILMRWSRVRTRRAFRRRHGVLQETTKVAVFGGGSFATAMGAALARQKHDLQVHMLLRAQEQCQHINENHENSRYLPGITLPDNLAASTDVHSVLKDAQYVIHAVPVQASRAFLKSVKDILPATTPVICVSKGIEQSTGYLMSEVFPSALGRRHPCVFVSGPSFAQEVLEGKLTCVVAASTDMELAADVQSLFAQGNMRINLSQDVQGVEISQGCAEIRWLATKMGARSETISGLSGFADIMLTCYGALSRNRKVGIRLGQGESISDILESSRQVAEGVATAGSVVFLARKYRVQLPVLTAVATVLADDCTIEEAVQAVIDLPQLEER